MSTENGYQGWKNYETWAVKLWMDNEEPTYRYWREAARRAWEDRHDLMPFETGSIGRCSWMDENDGLPRAIAQLETELKTYHDENMPEAINEAIQGTVYADLLNAALSEVDWREIAESLLEDAKEHA